jgi:serine/threonine protein kinase
LKSAKNLPAGENAQTHFSAKAAVEFDVARIESLCQSFQPKIMNTTAINISKVALSMMNTVKDIVPAPFNSVAAISANLVSLAVNCEVNTVESCRLADRVARISFGVLQLTVKPGSFAGASLIATQLLDVFQDAVQLLRLFQPESLTKRSFLTIVKSKIALFSESTAQDFAMIHSQLTVIMQDRAFIVSVSDQSVLAPPSIEQIQQGIQQELSHVIGEVRKVGAETGERIDHIDAQMQSLLSVLTAALPNHLRSSDAAVLDPRSLKINSNVVLGRGASGIVYSGTLYGSINVAVKVLLRQPSTEGLADLTHELERTIRVAHKNVIKVYGIVTSCSECENKPVVVMELLGQSLETVLGKLAPSQLMKLTTDIISGMDRVHSLDDGVVHFDLKPQNVMLTLDGRTAKIIDFGIAQSKTTVAFSSPNMTARARGTVAFMAPEILLGTSRGFPCDVYSFSVLLFALWSGRTPWQGFTDNSVITAVQQGSRPATDYEMIGMGVPEPVIAVITACWDQSPGNRPSFRLLMQLREVDMFWEAPVSRWPPFLAARAEQGNNSPINSVFFSTQTTLGSASSTVSGNTTTSSGARSGPSSMGGAAITTMNCEQLCLWLVEEQQIDSDVVDWVRSKKITGDIFCISGAKVVAKLRTITEIDEWHVDALERCQQRASAAVQAEAERQQKLVEAREQVADSAKQRQLKEEAARAEAEQEIERAEKAAERAAQKAQAERLLAATEAEAAKVAAAAAAKRDADKKAFELAAAEREAETRLAVAAAKAAEYDRCQRANMKAVNAWVDVWTHKRPDLVDAVYRNHYDASKWSGTLDLLGRCSFCNDMTQAKAHSHASIREPWTYIPSTFVVYTLTDTFVRFKYSTYTTNPRQQWTGNVTFEFNPPGCIIKSAFVITKG